MNENGLVRILLVLALASGAAFGCGDDDAEGDGHGHDGGSEPDEGNAGNSGGGEPVSPGDEVSAEITAAEGGEITLGGVTANIPAGALADDTEITIEVLDKADQPGADDIVADVFDFGPDGTTFEKPVTLEFDVGSLDVPNGMQAAMAYLDGSAWVALDDSELAGGKVTATTTHFTPFTIVLIVLPDGGIGQVGGMCETDDFDACGGDLVGTWEYTAGCATLGADPLSGEGDNNPFAMCTDAPRFSITVDLGGTTTFADDSTFTLDQTVTTSSSITIPASCIEQLLMGMSDPAMGCEDILEGMLDADGNCVQEQPAETKMNMATGTWEADATAGTLTITSDSADAGMKNEEIEYCVQGNMVTVVVRNLDEGFTIRYEATRK